MSTSKTLRFALLANLSLVAAGCGVFGSSDDTTAAAPAANDDPAMMAPGKKAVAVGGPADPSQLTETFGVFVTPNGTQSGDGSRQHPLATIQAGIDLGTRVGKRVYVCKGSYAEALVLADSISVIGGLDCADANEWRTSTTDFSRIVAPASPAIRAKQIATATRLEGLDVVAPDATDASASSIGLQAEGSNLTVARSKITAGNGANGADGVDGVALTPSISGPGDFLGTNQCAAGTTCISSGGNWYAPANAAGGTNTCIGVAGHDGGKGGDGGSGGIYKQVLKAGGVNEYYWQPQNNNPAWNATNGQAAGSGANGTNGTNGTSAVQGGSFTSDGYVAAAGSPGTDGSPGGGGAGGDGAPPGATVPAGSQDVRYWWRGDNGAAGGAGGCPGLAGSAGGGGGASIAVYSFDSAIQFDAALLVTAKGGNGGPGSFGSDATIGGKGGQGFATLLPQTPGHDGGRGGSSGVSGNGASGPSLGIVQHGGTAPALDSGTKITLGAGGDAIDDRSTTDAFGTAKTIPATPAGISKEILSF